MRLKHLAALAALAVANSACYHVTVTTGRPEGTQKIERPWTNSFVYGLVPPPPIETASRCTNGVAKVDIQRSFINSLVGGLTWSLYTPMDVRVVCAAGR